MAYQRKTVRMLISVTPDEKRRLEEASARLGVQAGPLARALVLDGLARLDQRSTRQAVEQARTESRTRRSRAGTEIQQRLREQGGDAQ